MDTVEPQSVAQQMLAVRAQTVAGLADLRAKHAAELEPFINVLKQCEDYLQAQAMTLSFQQIMDRRWALIEEQAIESKRNQTVLELLAKGVASAETAAHAYLTTQGLQNAKLPDGRQIFFQKGAHCGVENMDEVVSALLLTEAPEGWPQETWDGVLGYLRAKGNWQLLTKAVNKNAVKEVVEATGLPPAGVKYEPIQTVQFRSGSK